MVNIKKSFYCFLILFLTILINFSLFLKLGSAQKHQEKQNMHKSQFFSSGFLFSTHFFVC
jgi:hypothetical protein